MMAALPKLRPMRIYAFSLPLGNKPSLTVVKSATDSRKDCIQYISPHVLSYLFNLEGAYYTVGAGYGYMYQGVTMTTATSTLKAVTHLGEEVLLKEGDKIRVWSYNSHNRRDQRWGGPSQILSFEEFETLYQEGFFKVWVDKGVHSYQMRFCKA